MLLYARVDIRKPAPQPVSATTSADNTATSIPSVLSTADNRLQYPLLSRLVEIDNAKYLKELNESLLKQVQSVIQQPLIRPVKDGFKYDQLADYVDPDA